MPALTHGRVKNGFNGAPKKNNAKSSNGRVNHADNNIRRNALLGGVGGRSLFVLSARNKQVSKNNLESCNKCN